MNSSRLNYRLKLLFNFFSDLMVNSDKYLTLIKTELCSGKRELGALTPPPFPNNKF